MTLATSAWLVVQPTISRAGLGSDARRGSSLPPSIEMPGVTVPFSVVSQALDGMVRASSCRAWLQSKRLDARLRTVSVRFWSAWGPGANLAVVAVAWTFVTAVATLDEPGR